MSMLATEQKETEKEATQNKQQLQKAAQLALTVGLSTTEKTVLTRRYMSYPLSVSPIFRLDDRSSYQTTTGQTTTGENFTDAERTQRAYLYRMNTSPGLLAGDVLGMSLKLEEDSSLLLADQAATKVHTMPLDGPMNNRLAKVHYDIEVGDRATLEFLPEPLILFADSTLRQTTNICLHPSAGLTWGEIILPGRLARGERYQFREYWSRLQIRALGSKDSSARAEQAWFVETMKLLGKDNPFAQSDLFASGSVLGSLILVLPEAIATTENLRALSQKIDRLSDASESLTLASSILPADQGLFIRAIAQTTRDLQSTFKTAASYVRQIRKQPPLPYSL